MAMVTMQEATFQQLLGTQQVLVQMVASAWWGGLWWQQLQPQHTPTVMAARDGEESDRLQRASQQRMREKVALAREQAARYDAWRNDTSQLFSKGGSEEDERMFAAALYPHPGTQTMGR